MRKAELWRRQNTTQTDNTNMSTNARLEEWSSEPHSESFVFYVNPCIGPKTGKSVNGLVHPYLCKYKD